uniref:Ig-like domain-containing protein n=1 Tax=Sphaeramia orbicularis TaxID=375764 RepID=A0A673C2C7_9TELE
MIITHYLCTVSMLSLVSILHCIFFIYLFFFIFLNFQYCPLTITPPEIVVRYGDPVSVNCSTTSPDVIGIGWEDVETENVSDVTWTVDKLEYWNMNPACFATLKDNSQCETIPNITVYKTPDIVSVSTLNISGPMVQGREFQLICNIINVAPVNSLKVKWYRNNETVHTEMFIDTSVTPKNVSSILKMTPGKDDNGAHFTCVAELHLGGNGPQPVPSEVSEPYIAVVDCESFSFGVIVVMTALEAFSVSTKMTIVAKSFTIYKCLTGQVLCSFVVVLFKETPDKVSILDNGPMVEGKEYHLKCDISDVVPADKVKVKWYRNDEYVQDMVSDTHVDPHNNNISAILTIIPKKDDNGANFTCVAELHLGENGPQPVPAATSEPYIAVVHYKPLFSSCPPYAGKEYEFIMNMVPCQADANPPTVVQWYYHETPINPFVPLTRNQSGKYRAEAENHVGKSSTSVDVTVECEYVKPGPVHLEVHPVLLCPAYFYYSSCLKIGRFVLYYYYYCCYDYWGSHGSEGRVDTSLTFPTVSLTVVYACM